MKRGRGFTLVELLAVIVILAIILAVAVPGIANIIEGSTKASFSNDAKLLLKAIELKKLENSAFDVSLIDKGSLKELLNVSDENYSTISVSETNGVLYVKLIGQGKWAGYTACGVYKNMKIVSDEECGPDFLSPVVSYSPNGTTTYIQSSNVTVTVDDENLDTSSLKYVWTISVTRPDDSGYTTSFTNGGTIPMPNENGIRYLHVMARDTNGNTTKTTREFKLDNEKPVITLDGNPNTTIYSGTIYSDAGATAVDNVDGDLTSNIIVTGTINPNLVGTYTLTYSVIDNAGNESATVTRIVNVVQSSYTFSYVGSAQIWAAPVTGTYKLEVWGAQGGGPTGGNGGYSVGEINLNKNQELNIYVGGTTTNNTGGWNGGGNGGQGSGYQAGAGGATDIRLGGTSLTDRIIVGGGGGGSTLATFGNGGAGGGLVGQNGTDQTSGYSAGKGGTQVSGGAGGGNDSHNQGPGMPGSFGQGGTGGIYSGGGGGGYYGGGGGTTYYAIGNFPGGGGSGYIGGVSNGQTIAGNESMPNPSGGTMIGKTGHGQVKVTFIIE